MVRFEDLERDPLGQMESLYAALGLGGFADARPKIERHLADVAGFRKAGYPPTDPVLAARLAREWSRCFEEWGYDPR